MRILHVLDHSLPYLSGYSFRSRYIFQVQQRTGLDVVVVTSPKHEEFLEECEVIDGIEHYRLRWPELTASSRFQSAPMIRQMTSLNVMTRDVERLARELHVDLIHAHSPSVNGLAVARVAARLKLPWIYELRYYDEDAAVDRGKFRYNSIRYRISKRLEQGVLAQAPRIAVISSALRNDLISRGVPESKLVDVPNGVDTEVFQPLMPDSHLARAYGISGKTVVGFIGSLYAYEGLSCLIDAMIEVLRRRDDVILLIVGEGEMEESLRGRVPEELKDEIVFCGRINHDEVQSYYSIMDIVVYPRLKSRLTELTTPLKPLEAMAMGKAVLASGVGGLLELVKDGESGLIFEPGDSGALAKHLNDLATDIGRRLTLGRKARDFASSHRDWSRIVSSYQSVYDELIDNGGTPKK